MSARVILSGEGLSKSFGGVHAVVGVDLALSPEAPVVTIIGPNGAGKTTLLNLLAGQVAPDAGRIVFEGRDVTALGMRRRARLGIGRTFQHTGIFKGLTPREHIRLANAGKVEIDELLAAFGLSAVADVRADELNHVSQRLLEIATIVASGPAVLMLDEPTAGMDVSEVEQVARVINRLRLSIQILIIEHDVDFVLSISDRIVVLDQGRVIADGNPADVRADARVAAAYMQRSRT